MQVVGIDPDEKRLEFAKKKYNAANLEFLKGDGTNIPGREYDIVYSNSVLHWCKDKSLLFKHVADCLKKGGKFGFVTIIDFDAEHVFYSSKNLFSPEYYQHLASSAHVPSTEEVLHLISSNNFSMLSSQKKLLVMRFADIHELIEYHMRHANRFFDKTHFNIEAMIRCYGEGEFSFDMPMLTVIAEKKRD